jgi:hypothetical protein
MKVENTFESIQDKRDQFLKELKALLVKFDAELALEDLGNSGWDRDDVIVVDFNFDESFFEKENSGLIPQLTLGKFFSGR